MRASAILLLPLLAAACAEDPAAPIELLVALDPIEGGLTLEVASGQGVGTAVVPVRLVNTYGMSVPGGSVSVSTSRGTLQASELNFDAFGYAEARVSSDVPVAFQLSTLSSTDNATPGASGWGAVLGSPSPILGMDKATFLPSNGQERLFSAAASNGIAVAVGDEIWWTPYSSGVPAHRVADLGEPIQGMVATEIDADGISDLVAWSGTSVFMLRGRSKGGYSWGAAFRTLNGLVTGASAGDLDGDRLTDVAIAISTDTAGYAGVLKGNGAWEFTPGEVAELTFPVGSLSAADEGFNGTPDLTLVNLGNKTLRRITWLEGEGWVGGSTPEISAYETTEGSVLLPQADLDADGIDELLLVGPPGASSQDLVFFTMGSVVTQFPQTYGQFYPAAGELDPNPGTELVALEEDLMHVTWWAEERANFVTKNYTDVGSAGPLAISDFDGDGIGDFAIASTHVKYNMGGLDVEGRYAHDTPDWDRFNVAMIGPIQLLDDNDDGISDVLGFVMDGETLSMGLWLSSVGDTGALNYTLSTVLAIGDGLEAHDFVACDEDMYALVGAGDTSTLHLITIGGGSTNRRPRSSASVEVTGSLLDCGVLGNGQDGAVVATTGGAWATFGNNLSAESSGNVGSTSDIALLEGSGSTEVVGCLGGGCSVATPDVDGDGADELVVSEEVLRVTVGGNTAELLGSGSLDALDVDGDGYEDLVATDLDNGTVALYRGVDGGLAPPVVYHTSEGLDAQVRFGDSDGDGTLEVFWLSDTGALLISPGLAIPPPE